MLKSLENLSSLSITNEKMEGLLMDFPEKVQ